MSSQDPNYQKALEETEYVDSVATGFTKSSGLSAGDLGRKAIQQNNTILQLLLRLHSRVETLNAEVLVIKNHLTNKPSTSTNIPEDLIQKLENLNLGPSEPKKTKKGIFFAFKDPYVIFEEEKAKLKQK